MSSFDFQKTSLPGLTVVKRDRAFDNRGFFSRLFCVSQLTDFGWVGPVEQINYSFTRRCGTVRGMHCQTAPHSEMKLVTCIKGKVWDVAIDLRESSPTFLHWHGEILSEENQNALLISEGFAHGFQSLSDDVEIIYCHNKAYSPGHELALNPVDPILKLQWPIEISEMSERDKNHRWIAKTFKGISF
tara:strand:- start:49 stop:609 length:561 start_codon:yes stop_codon:yes gene_type:complete